MPHVFISYVHENREIVSRLCGTLKAHGLDVWLDRERIRPGYKWKDAIADAIIDGAFFLACFSSDYAERNKTYMNEELTLAIEELRLRPTNRAWFIPVLLSKCSVPNRNIGGGESLRSIQWVALYENWDFGIQQILNTIQPDKEFINDSILLLKSKSARARIRAADDLGKVGNSAGLAVPTLIDLLDDDNETVCAAAAEAIGRIGIPNEKAVIKLILMTQKTTDHYSGKHADFALVRLSNKAIPILIEQLSNGSEEIKQGVLELLIKMGKDAHPAISAITTTLFSDRIPIRVISAEALGAIGDKKAVPSLIKALSYKNVWAVRAAARALADIGDSRAISSLRELVLNTSEDFRIREGAVDALEKFIKHSDDAIAALREAHTQSLEEGDDLLTIYIARSLADINDPDIVSSLCRLLFDSPYRDRAPEALGRYATRSDMALTALLEVVEQCRNRLDDYLVAQVAVSAARALPVIYHATSVPCLREILFKNGNMQLRGLAARALGKFCSESDEAIQALRAVLKRPIDNENVLEVIEAAGALSRINDPVAVESLLNILSRDSIRDSEKRTAAKALRTCSNLSDDTVLAIDNALDQLAPIDEPYLWHRRFCEI